MLVLPVDIVAIPGRKKVSLLERMTCVTNSFTKMILRDASELFLEEVLNLTALEQVAQKITGAPYVHVLIIKHPNPYWGVCARITFGVSVSDPHSDYFWVPVDTRFLTS